VDCNEDVVWKVEVVASLVVVVDCSEVVLWIVVVVGREVVSTVVLL